MMDFLAGVPGKLKTLVDRLTATRATNLDNLDTTVSSRAAAATALSTATWTGTRAAKLDNLDYLTAAPMSSVVASIQYVTCSFVTTDTTSDSTITSVDTSKTIIIPAGVLVSGSGGTMYDANVRWNLYNATTARAGRAGGPTKNAAASAWVVELK